MPKSAAKAGRRAPPKSVRRKLADAKIHEQKAAGARLSARHAHSRKPSAASKVDAKLDKALRDSFPGSDPVSFIEVAPIKEHDRALSTVPSRPPVEKKD